jgi:hypothetical protein
MMFFDELETLDRRIHMGRAIKRARLICDTTGFSEHRLSAIELITYRRGPLRIMELFDEPKRSATKGRTVWSQKPRRPARQHIVWSEKPRKQAPPLRRDTGWQAFDDGRAWRCCLCDSVTPALPESMICWRCGTPGRFFRRGPDYDAVRVSL